MSMNAGDEVKGHSLPRAYADLTVPNYGVEVPQGVDFAKYNESRTDKNDKVRMYVSEIYIIRIVGKVRYFTVLNIIRFVGLFLWFNPSICIYSLMMITCGFVITLI